ncbi:unnamed protein product [Prunus armeniaca]
MVLLGGIVGEEEWAVWFVIAMASFVRVLRLLARMVPTIWELSWRLFIAGYFWHLLKEWLFDCCF